MKGNAEVLLALNGLLSDELTAINQYIVHSEMADNHGYKKLGDYIQKRALTEMGHTEKLIARILFLEGTPDVSSYGKITIGKDVPSQFNFDHDKELAAIEAYNRAIDLSRGMADNDTAELLKEILGDEMTHIHEIEENQTQIQQMSLENYLSIQV